MNNDTKYIAITEEELNNLVTSVTYAEIDAAMMTTEIVEYPSMGSLAFPLYVSKVVRSVIDRRFEGIKNDRR